MSSATSTFSRRLIVLGSTGSIGVHTLEVVRHLQTNQSMNLRVVGLAGGRNAQLLIRQAQEHQVAAVAVADEGAGRQVREALPGVRVYQGPEAARQLVEETDATDLSAAIVGSAGLEATLAGVRKGMRIGLANKETLVAAGALVTPEVRRCGAELIPVDSEHSAIFQCLAARQDSLNGRAVAESSPGAGDAAAEASTKPPFPFNAFIKRIVLTASGGPFRNTPRHVMQDATVEQALAHPTWKMGAKITIDSATMMNKALEIIEAHWLFDLPPERIDVIVHPQSVVHSFVEFTDHSVLAQLGPPDMRTPIQYALTYPRRTDGCSRAMDWNALSQLEFFPPDPEKFPALRLAYDVIRAGGTAGAVFNAANEAAVAAFLEQRIRFGRIVELVHEALAAIAVQPLDSLATAMQADALAREFIRKRLD